MKHKILQLVAFTIFVVVLVLFAIYLGGLKTEKQLPQSVANNSDSQVDNHGDKIFQSDLGRQYTLRGNTILGSGMVVADPSSLEYVGGVYFKDKINVYAVEGVPGNILQGVNPKTFKVIGGFYQLNFQSWHYTLENDRVMYVNAGFLSDFTQTVLHADPERFRVFDGAYMTDDTSFFFQDKKIPTDRDSFRVLPLGSDKKYSHYSKDKKYVFYAGDLLYNADPNTFEVITLDKFILGKDAKQVFIDGRLLDGISSSDLQLEVGKKMGYVLSDYNTNWYYFGHCEGAQFISEQDFFQDQYKDWDKIKYLEEYVYC